MKIPESKIAVILYTLREYCKTESDFDRTLDKVCDIGYESVQVSGVSLAPEVIRRQLDSHNLYCCATHEGMNAVRNPQSIIDRLDILGSDIAALGMPTRDFFTGESAKVEELVGIFNASGAAMQKAGKRLGYHNHALEFIRVQGTRQNMLERFYSLTDPACVFAELDVHWVARGGGNPETWIRRMAGRMPIIHFKDFAMVNEQPTYCEVGEGNLDWPGIIRACEEIGVRWYSVEQDEPFPGRDIFDSIRISFNNLKAFGVK